MAVDGNRALRSLSSLSVMPAYLLGCGGAGVRCLREAKRRLAGYLGLLETPGDTEPHGEIPPLVQFHGLDTVPLSNAPGEFRLRTTEYTPLGGFNASLVLQTMRQSLDQQTGRATRYPEIARWWDSDFDPGMVAQGAKQIRAIGRLAFYYHFRQFQRDFARNLDMLRRIIPREQTEERGIHVLRRSNQIKVYIISSLCGGTGAGLFLDVAAWIRAVLLDEAYLIGVLLMPSVFLPVIQADIQQRRIQANAYAAIKELEYLQANPDAYQFAFPGEGERHIPYLFNRIYLVERENQHLITNEAETLSGPDEVYQMVGQQIALELCTPLGARFWEYDVNIHIERHPTAPGSGLRLYSGFANTALTVPRQHVVLETTRRLHAALQQAIESARDLSSTAAENHRQQADRLAERLDQTVWDSIYEALERQTELPQAVTLWYERALADLRQTLTHIPPLHWASFLSVFSETLERFIDRRHREKGQVDEELLRVETTPSQPSLKKWIFSALLQFLPIIGSQIKAHRREEERQARERDKKQRSLATRQKMLEHQITGLKKIRQAVDHLRQVTETRYQQLRDALERFDSTASLDAIRRKYHIPHFELCQEVEANSITQGVLSGSETLHKQVREALDILLQEAFRLQIEETDLKENRLTLPPFDLTATTALSRLQQAVLQAAGQWNLLDILEKLPPEARERRIRHTFERCHPFWRFRPEWGFDPADLQVNHLIGIDYTDNTKPRWDKILRDIIPGEIVATNDPLNLYAVVAAHGLAAGFIASLPHLYEHYSFFTQGGRRSPVHVFPATLVEQMPDLLDRRTLPMRPNTTLATGTE